MQDGHVGTGAAGTSGSTYTVRNIYNISTNSSSLAERALTIGIVDVSTGTTTGCPEPQLGIGYMWNQYSSSNRTNQQASTGAYATWIARCRERASSAGSSSGDLKKVGNTSPSVQNTIDNYVCVGPFRLSYGSNGVDGVRVNGSNRSVYYSTGTGQSAFNSKKLVSTYGVPNGSNFYLWIRKADLGNGESATIRFTQTYTYYSARLIFLTGSGLQNCMAYKGRSSSGSTYVSYSFELGATLKIMKKDGWSLSGSNYYLNSFQVTVRNTSNNKYYDANGGEHSSAYRVTVSSKNGLTITGLPEGRYEVTEVGAPINYSLAKQTSPPQSEGASRTKYKETTGRLTAGSETTVTLQNVKYTDLKIVKKDSSKKTGISDVYFTIQDSKTGEYIAANGSRQRSAVELKTGSDGTILIKDILIPYEGTKFIVKELRTDNLYYYVPSGGYTFEITAANNYNGKVSTVNSSSGNGAYSSGGTIYNEKAYSLTLIKRNKESGAPAIATFHVQYEDGTWLTADGDYSTSRSDIQTTSDGSKTIYVKRGTYHIYEVGVASGFKLELQDGYDPVNKWIDCGSVTVNNSNKEVSITMYNKKYTNLEVKKVDTDTGQGIEGIGFTIYHNRYRKYVAADGSLTDTPTILYTNASGLIHIENIVIYDDGDEFTVREVVSNNLYYKTDTSIMGTISAQGNGTVQWSTTTIKNTRPYALTVEKIDPDMTSEQLTAGFYIQYDDGTWLTQSGEYSNSPSAITVTRSVTIPKIKRGVYHIYEYRTPVGYDPVQQDGYGEDPSHPDWIDCGIAHVGVDGSGAEDTNVCEVSLTKDNKKYISKITGYVWVDNRSGKVNEYDYRYTEGSEDQKLSGIKVDFMENERVIASTTTGSDGSYTFSFYKQILYWDLQNYKIRFTYDNETYTVVPINVDAEATNASRAIESHDWESDELATGTGEATSIPNAGSLQDSMAKYYNVNNYCIESINLGLMVKPNEEFSIIENLDYVRLVKGNYTFTYEYGKDAIVQEVPEREYIYDTVALQNSARSFTRKLYPSDIAYNNTVTENKFEVYVGYKISITNTMNINMQDLYVEKTLNITSLTSTYNTSIYELADNNWQAAGRGQARYNHAIQAMAPAGTAEVSVQFKVTESGLQELIQGAKNNPEIYKECATTAIADGYHIYDRNDYSWTYSPNAYQKQNEHRTKGETRESSALTLRLTLAEQRTISGIIFEDTQTAESEQNHTRLGNGLYDTNENKLKGVTVSLFNKEDNQIASLYSTEGDYLKREANGTWTFTKQEATVEVNEDGSYALKGVIPGEYYLQELEAPYGYKLNPEKIYFEVTDKDVTLEVEDELIKKEIVIEKYLEEIDGELELEKKASFDVLDYETGKLITSFTTNEYGKFSLILPFGKYILRQTASTVGYNLSQDIILTVNEDSPTSSDLIIRNKKIKGSLLIEKKDSATKDFIMEEAEFQIYNVDTKEYLKIDGIDIFKTKDGKLLIENIPYGSYELIELTAPKNYQKTEERISFQITKEQEVITLEVLNKLQNGSLEIIKVDDKTLKPIPGVLFGLYDQDQNLIEEYYTNEEGKITIENLLEGLYYIKELNTLDDYELLEGFMEVQVKNNILNSLLITNRLKVEVPLTGTNEFFLSILFSSLCLLLGVYLCNHD